MRTGERIAREDALTDALRAANLALGDHEPDDQALRIIEAIKRLRAGWPTKVVSLERIDYAERARNAARAAWTELHSVTRVQLSAVDGATSYNVYRSDGAGIHLIGTTSGEATASATVETPLGRLTAVASRQTWAGGREAWHTLYKLDGRPITLTEMRAACLMQRPTTRNRQKKAGLPTSPAPDQ